MFVFSFKNDNDDPMRLSFDEYYMSLVDFKDFMELIDNKPFLDQPVKNKQEAYEKLVKMSKINNGTTKDDTKDLNLVMPMYNLIE